MTKPETLEYTTEVKGKVTMEQALEAFRDHAFFLRTDPNMISFEADTQPHGGVLHPIPDGIGILDNPIDGSGSGNNNSKTRCYDVVDKMPGIAFVAKLLPGLSTINNYYQITDTKDGLFVFLQAAMGVSQERRWIVYHQDDEVFKVVEQVTIHCGRLLYGTLKGQQELHWKDVHASYVKKMGGEVGVQSWSPVSE